MSSKKSLPPGRILPRQSSLFTTAPTLPGEQTSTTPTSPLGNNNNVTASMNGGGGNSRSTSASSSGRKLPPEPIRTTSKRATPPSKPLPQPFSTKSQDPDPFKQQSTRRTDDSPGFKSESSPGPSPLAKSSVLSPAVNKSLSPALKAQQYSPVQQSSLRYSPSIPKDGDDNDEEDEERLSKFSPKQEQVNMPDSSSDTTTTSSSKGRSIQALLKSLETKAKPELLAITKKMVSEINVKNRIINESKINEKWILAQLAIAQNGSNVALGANPTALQTKFARSSSSVEDKEFLQTLMAFKAELGAAKKKIEEHEVSLLIMEKKRTAAEEEAAYLRTIIDPKLKDKSVPQVSRIKELEKQLNETIQDYTTLQSKVSQWARASKRNQEGRITAEAVQKALEEENEALKMQLSGMGMGKQQLQQTIPSSLDESEKIKELEEQLVVARTAHLNSERQADAEIDAMERKQVELLDTIEALRIKNQELQDSVGARNEYQDIIKKRSSMLLDVKPAPAPTRNANDMDVSREYRFLKDKYAHLEEENEELRQSEQDLMRKLDLANKNYEKAMETVEDQEELQLTIKEMEADKKTLQDAYNVALDKVQQKTLAIEMLQRNVDRTRERMEPLQKSVEALDDLQDVLDQERYQKEELQDRIAVLEEDAQSQQKKIMDLMEQLGNQQAMPENAAMNEVLDLRDTVEEYKSMTDTLRSQIDEKIKQIEQMKKQNTSDASKAQLEAAAATAAEQVQTIEQLEELIAEDNQIIETLTAEKGELEQELRKAKSEHASLQEQLKVREEQQSVTSLKNDSASVIDNLQAQLDQSKSRLDTITQEREDLIDRLEAMQSTLRHFDGLDAKVQELAAENKNLTEQLESRGSIDDENLEVRIQRLEEALSSLSTEKEQLLSQIQSFHGMEEDYKDEVSHRKDLESRLAEMDAEMNFIQSEFDMLSQKNHGLEQELALLGKAEPPTRMDRQSTISDLTEKSGDPSPIKVSYPLLSRSQEDLSGLVTQLDAAEMEIEDLRMQLAEKGHSSTLERVDTAVSPIRDADDDRIENDFFKISLHEKELQEKQNEIEKLLNELDSLEEHLLQVSEEKNDLERQSRRMLNEITEKHRMELESKIKEIALLEERLEGQLDSSNGADHVRDLQREIEDLKLQLVQNHSPSLSIAHNQEDIIHRLEEELEALSSQVREKNETILLLKDELHLKAQQSKVDGGDLSAKLIETERLLGEKESLISDLQSTIAATNKKLDDANTGSDHTEADQIIQKLNLEIADYKKKVANLEDTIADLQDKLDYHSEIAEDALKQLDQYESEILELRQQSSRSDPQAQKDLQSAIKAKDAELATLKAQVMSSKDAMDEIHDLERTNEQLLDKIASLSQKIAQQDNNRMSINPNLLNQKAAQDAKAELDEVKLQLNEAIVKINSFQNEKAELLDELDDLRDHNMILISQLQQK